MEQTPPSPVAGAAPQFFLSIAKVQHKIYIADSFQFGQRFGQQASTPCLPGVTLFYREETGTHYLTEATTGLALATAPTRAGLHAKIAYVAYWRGAERVKRQCKKWIEDLAKSLYFVASPKPRRRAA